VFLEVAFPIPLNKTFHYALPESLVTPHLIGRRVLAPFGMGKSSIGFVVGTTTEVPPFQTKPVTAWCDAEPVITPAMLELTRWVAERYLCSWGEALAGAWPPALSAPKRPGSGLTTGQICHIVRPDPGRFTLTADQDLSIEAIAKDPSKPFLLHGVTDSGKTEIYLQIIDRALADGRQALYLLPEIAMTPPFYRQLQERYGEGKVGLWHSGLTPNERYRVWTGVQRGDIPVLLGARSAVFAPFPKLGVMVIDEEHEPAYKQEERPRYHTRDVALKRGALEKATVILGSATPSLESYGRAQAGDYHHLRMKTRIHSRALPVITLVDRRHPETPAGTPKRRPTRGGFTEVFSEPLKLAIEQRLARREQVMLFVNRRGFMPFVRCSACGWVARCPKCSLTMTVHLKSDAAKTEFVPSGDTQLICHGCSRHDKAPVDCPSCKKLKLHLFGIGTQRIERELQMMLPFARVLRMDHDTGKKRHAPEQMVQAFLRGEADILVGTQMIAKGFDFPRVTLVGVVDADVSLHLPDFRSAERTFQLITQVAGRAGRGDRPGKVVVQTHYADHYALQAASRHDYEGFYKEETANRQMLNYPPACRLVRVLIRATKEAKALAAAEALVDPLQKAAPEIEILGPAPSPHPRLRSQFRYHLLLKGSDAALQPALRYLRSWKPRQAFAVIDVDPQDML